MLPESTRVNLRRKMMRAVGVSSLMNLFLVWGAELGACEMTNTVIFLKHKEGKMAGHSLALESQ